jgi:hypothetical protein
MTNPTYLLDCEQFSQFRTAFKTLAHKRALLPSDLLLYNFLRDLPKERGFSPITNKRKLENGSLPMISLQQAFSHLKYLSKYRKEELRARFGGVISSELLDVLLKKGE